VAGETIAESLNTKLLPTRMVREILMTSTVQGARIPDSKLAREITELVRDTESPLRDGR
jgi:hypothetical protein